MRSEIRCGFCHLQGQESHMEQAGHFFMLPQVMRTPQEPLMPTGKVFTVDVLTCPKCKAVQLFDHAPPGADQSQAKVDPVGGAGDSSFNNPTLNGIGALACKNEPPYQIWRSTEDGWIAVGKPGQPPVHPETKNKSEPS